MRQTAIERRPQPIGREHEAHQAAGGFELDPIGDEDRVVRLGQEQVFVHVARQQTLDLRFGKSVRPRIVGDFVGDVLRRAERQDLKLHATSESELRRSVDDREP